MKILLFNDTNQTWKRHAAGYGPSEILPHTGGDIIIDKHEAVFVKIWDGMFLVRGITDAPFANDIGNAIGQEVDSD